MEGFSYNELFISILSDIQKEKNYSIREIADKIDVKAKSIYNVKQGRPASLELLIKLVNAFPEYHYRISHLLPNSDRLLDIIQTQIQILQDENQALRNRLNDLLNGSSTD